MDNKYLREGNSIKSILKQFALENKISELMLDYSLISYKTYLLKYDEDSKEYHKILIDNAEIGTYLDTQYNIVQDYVIEIFRRKNSFYPILIQLQSNDNNTELKALIYTQRIPQNGDLGEIIRQTIFNICAYRGIIIGLGWNNINPDIAEVVTKLKSQDHQPEYYTIDIARLIEPKMKNIAIRLLISKNNKVSILSHNSLLLNGGFFKVIEGEILLSYTKPSYDFPWRSIYGKIYGIAQSYPIGIEASEGIEVEYEDDKILYIAKRSGYLSIVGQMMMISPNVIVGHINNKNIINIQEQEIDDIIVKNDNLTQDVVSSGINLCVKKLRIVGNVGAVHIQAQDLSINGQVHIKSNIKAENASILHFKGKLEAKNAEIRYCENAFIQSDNLSINYVNGSKLYFSQAKISNIQSNNTMYIQEDLYADNVLGKNNEFIFHPCIYGESKANLDAIKNKILNLNKLKSLFVNDGAKLQYEATKNRLLYEYLSQKSTNLIDPNLYDWRKILDCYLLRRDNSNSILTKYNALMESFKQNDNELEENIREKMDKMFDIVITFGNKCNVDFYVGFIDFYGIKNRFHINANERNAVKKVTLKKGDDKDSIKILCYKN